MLKKMRVALTSTQHNLVIVHPYRVVKCVYMYKWSSASTYKYIKQSGNISSTSCHQLSLNVSMRFQRYVRGVQDLICVYAYHTKYFNTITTHS